MAIDLTKLTQSELLQIVNSTPQGEMLTRSRLRRQMDAGALRFGDGANIHLVRYVRWLVDEMDRPRPTRMDYAEARRRQAEKNRAATKSIQDIAPIPEIEDYPRRKACGVSFRLFCEMYFPAAFHRAWSDDHLRVIAKIEKAVREGGLFAFAMPRGSGKTTLARCAALWAVLYGYRPFICLIGAADDRAKELLLPIKKHMLENPLLLADFPEAVHPLRALENSSKRQLQQHCHGRLTHVHWGQNKLVFPTVEGEDLPRTLRDEGLEMSPSCGSIITTTSLDANMRGQQHTRVDGSIIRPSLVLLDDPQTRDSARSVDQTHKRLELLNGDVLGMAGPGEQISALMTCTKMYEGDLADTVLDREKHPLWQGERTKLVYSFPTNIKLWDEYARIRAESYRNDGDGHEATEFYRNHRADMDAGTAIAWPQRYNADEISAIQHAMNLRFRDEAAFFAEYQNEPIADLEGVAAMMVTTTQADGFTEKEFVDSLGRLRYRIRSDATVTEGTRYDLDASGRVTAVTYPDGRKMRYIYKTGYNPDDNTESGTATEYPSFDVVEFTENQQTIRRVLARYTYGVTDFPALPLTKVVYKVGDNDDVANGVEGTDKFTTDMAYNSDGTPKYQVQPKVNGLLAAGENAKDYRLGTEFTYNSLGQVVYEKHFICDAYTVGSQSFTNRVDQTQTKNEYYSTGASNGLLLYVTVDEGTGKLNLKTEYQYDNWRNPYKTIVDPDGLAITTEYTYDPSGLLLAAKSPGGYFTDNTYDRSGRLIQVNRYEDSTKAVQLGKAQYVYDLHGRQSNAKQWFGSGANDYVESYMTYDSRGRVDSQVEPPDADSHRHGRRYTYDKWGHVTQVAVGGTWSGDQTGSWSSNPDAVAKTAFAANHYGEGLTDTASDGYDDSVSDSDYDARGRLAKILRKKSDVNFGDSGTLRTTLQVEYTYGDRGMVTMVQSKDTDGTLFNQTTSTYDGMGRLKEQSVGDGGQNSLTTGYDYDAQGRVWRVTDPSGNHIVTEYDATSRQTKVTDGENNIVTYAYNAAGQLIKTIRKDHKPGEGTDPDDYLWYVVSFAYDSEGRITKVTDEGEDVDRNGDGDGKDGTDADPESNEDFLAVETHYYDSAYEPAVVTTDPLSHHTKVVHDGLGRQLWLREGGSGTLGSETYARETRFDYDAAGRQTAIVSGGPDGKVDAPYAADNQTTSYGYNSHGQVASVQYPDASPNTVSYTYYTNNDALASVTDQKNIVTSYTYKAVADGSDYNVEARQYVFSGTPDGGDRDVITTANGLGQVLSVVTKDTAGGTQTSRVTRQYKFCGALWKETQQIGDSSGDSRTVEYGFDSCGKVNKLYWPHTGTAGNYVEYANFDGLNRARTYSNNISQTGTTIATYTFLGGRPATKEYPQSDSTKTVRQTFWSSSETEYDHYGRLATSHAVRNPAGTPVDVMKVNYAYDDSSNPAWRYDELSNDPSGRKWSQKYEYDVMDRLVKAQQGTVGGTWPSSPSMTADKTWVWDGTQGGNTYTLDKVGNWAKFYNNGTDDERTHNAVNETTGRTVGGTAKNPSWDNTGCLTDDGENFTYKYDFRNRLVEATRKGGNKLAAYSYDGLNRRIRKVVFDTDGTTETSDTRFLYDGWRCVEERNENDSHKLLARYVYGGLYIDEPLRMYRDTDADGDFADAGDVNVYYLQDRLFNVVALTNTDGAIVERTWYELYGKPTNRRESDGDETAASHFGSPALFCGYILDAESSNFLVRYRAYHPSFGGWIQRDPMQYMDGLNLYQYCRSQPVWGTDPFGTLVIGMGGLFHIGDKELQAFMEEIVADINKAKPGLRGGEEFYTPIEGDRGNGMPKLVTELKAYRDRKDKDSCWHEQIVLVGFSDGATSIWKLFGDNQINPALASVTNKGSYHIAYVGFVDMVRKSFNMFDKEGGILFAIVPGKKTTLKNTELIVKGDNFFQQDDHWDSFNKWKGHVSLGGAPIFDQLEIKEVTHKGHLSGDLGGDWGHHIFFLTERKSILLDAGMRASLKANAVKAYTDRETGNVKDERNPLVD